MDNARLNTIVNALDRLPLEDYEHVLLFLFNRLEPVAQDAANYCERARAVCQTELAGVTQPPAER